MLTIKTTITSKLPALTKALNGPAMAALLKQTGDDVVAQVRRNMLTGGKSSGEFAQLSGWGGYRDRDDKGHFIRKKKGETSKHTGYAREKELAKERGQSAFGPDVKLRRTEQLIESLVAKSFTDAHSARVELHAAGSYPDGTPVETVMAALFLGVPAHHLPARNPLLNMAQVEARFAARLKKVVADAAA